MSGSQAERFDLASLVPSGTTTARGRGSLPPNSFSMPFARYLRHG